MVKPDKPMCCKKMWQGYGYKSTCMRPGKYCRDSKWYCGTHDPVRIKEREEKRKKDKESIIAERKERQAKIRMEKAHERAERGIIDTCPFCGGKAHYVPANFIGENTADSLECKNPECRARGPIKSAAIDAVTKWNFRG